MKKKYKVKVTSVKEGRSFKKALEAIGEKTASKCVFDFNDLNKDLVFNNNNEWIVGCDKDNREVISFKELLRLLLSEETSDKTPLIISEDKVLLFEGDEFYLADYCHDQKWKLTTLGGNAFKIDDETPMQTELMKYFSTKEAALAWIEAKQPKEIEVKLMDGKTANVFLDLVRIFNGHSTMNIKPSDIEAISNALKTLSK